MREVVHNDFHRGWTLRSHTDLQRAGVLYDRRSGSGFSAELRTGHRPASLTVMARDTKQRLVSDGSPGAQGRVFVLPAGHLRQARRRRDVYGRRVDHGGATPARSD